MVCAVYVSVTLFASAGNEECTHALSRPDAPRRRCSHPEVCTHQHFSHLHECRDRVPSNSRPSSLAGLPSSSSSVGAGRIDSASHVDITTLMAEKKLLSSEDHNGLISDHGVSGMPTALQPSVPVKYPPAGSDMARTTECQTKVPRQNTARRCG